MKNSPPLCTSLFFLSFLRALLLSAARRRNQAPKRRAVLHALLGVRQGHIRRALDGRNDGLDNGKKVVDGLVREALDVARKLGRRHKHRNALNKRDRLGAELDGRRSKVADGKARHGRAPHAHLVRHKVDVLERAPLLPRHLQAAALVEAGLAREADARLLVADGGEKPAAIALLAWVDKVAARRRHDALRRAPREDAAGAVDAGLRRAELGRVKGGVVEPVNHVGHLHRIAVNQGV